MKLFVGFGLSLLLAGCCHWQDRGETAGDLFPAASVPAESGVPVPAAVEDPAPEEPATLEEISLEYAAPEEAEVISLEYILPDEFEEEPPFPAEPVQADLPAEAGETEPPPAVPAALELGTVGGIEAIFLPGFAAPFEARVDTGAQTSSIDARDIRRFERDGKKWVAFRMVSELDGEERFFELPVVRSIRVKQQNDSTDRRPVVLLTFRLGHLTLEREFSLVDRSGFKYPVLLGRNVINGLAVVDPARRNLL